MQTKVSEFFSTLSPGGRLAGIDWGRERMGISLSDPLFLIATPLITLQRCQSYSMMDHLVTLLNEHEISGIVLGLPLKEDGTENPLCPMIRKFAKALQDKYPCPLLFWNERLSSYEAKNLRPKIQNVDHIAASLLLQEVLNQKL